ncbi:LPS-assembly protein LptD [Alkalicaulis satelles]|uniref:LPS-assembly protein LptD n=1 Tax=Alkalicaulis satelles TaxID=2609175 RepID=A0A5M6ZJ78_9PROT|nr:LPS assembly protein LptD [Alkalicaulis satelles]KAA5804065.1 LPS-assembly protein LptD [Alkalicaulis satelles]
MVRRALLSLGCALAFAIISVPAQALQDEDGRAYLEANELVEDRARGVYIARGQVVMYSDGRTVRADEIHYDPALGRITARGSVEIHEPGQPGQTAEYVELDDELREGFARGFAALLENNGRTAAALALRRADGGVELSDAYYTACELCEDGSRQPTWRLRADQVIQDTGSQMIRYRNVRLDVRGVPVFYAPVFAHADPSVGRKSGFMGPDIDISNRLGFTWRQPYFWAISPHQDLTIAPRVMTEANPLLELTWRKRFWSGYVRAQTAATWEREFDRDGKFGDAGLRGHMFATGEFDINRFWRWGFGVQAVTGGDLFLRRYGYSEDAEGFESLFTAPRRDLISQIWTAGRGQAWYADAAAYQFNRLSDTFDDKRLPVAAPQLRGHYQLALPANTGVAEFSFNALSLTRELGDDYHRASAGVEWSRPVILPGGLRAEPFAVGRADIFDITERTNAGVETGRFDGSRALGAAGADVSWPFLRPGDRVDVILAPRLSAVAATGVDATIPPNFDSQTIDLDRSFMFAPVRSPGFDLWEDGARADIGLSAEFSEAGGSRGVELFAGRSIRLSGDERFPQGSGVSEDRSDWVAEGRLDYDWLRLGARARLDGDTWSANRVDANAAVQLWRASLSARYTDVSGAGAARNLREISVSTQLELTDRWSGFYRHLHDLDAGESRRIQTGFLYRDECTILRVYYQRENERVSRLGPSESLKFEIVLFTLGGAGSR